MKSPHVVVALSAPLIAFSLCGCEQLREAFPVIPQNQYFSTAATVDDGRAQGDVQTVEGKYPAPKTVAAADPAYNDAKFYFDDIYRNEGGACKAEITYIMGDQKYSKLAVLTVAMGATITGGVLAAVGATTAVVGGVTSGTGAISTFMNGISGSNPPNWTAVQGKMTDDYNSWLYAGGSPSTLTPSNAHLFSQALFNDCMLEINNPTPAVPGGGPVNPPSEPTPGAAPAAASGASVGESIGSTPPSAAPQSGGP